MITPPKTLAVDPNFVYQLLRQYGEPHRKFHTAEHLRHLFMTLEQFHQWRMEIEGDYWELDLDLMFLCICLHDWFYIPGDPSNEEDSANMVDLLIPHYPKKEWVREIIRATKDHKHLPVVDEFTFHRALMIDLDLSGLGSPYLEFLRTDKQIEDEFVPFVGPKAYHEGRPKFLQGLLDREEIFGLLWFHNKFDQTLRENIQDALDLYKD